MIATRPALDGDKPYLVWLEEACMREYAVALWGDWPSSLSVRSSVAGCRIIVVDEEAAGCVTTEALAKAVRGHWGVESMHWLLDVAFKEDMSRTRTGHGAKNMAVVRRFALNLVRANPDKGSVKTKRKSAGWNPTYLFQILDLKRR